MRIAYYSRSLVSPAGAGVHARALVDSWRVDGHDVLCLPSEFPPGSRGPRSESAAGLRLSGRARDGGRAAKAVGRFVMGYGAAKRALGVFRPDLVIARRFQRDWALDRLLDGLVCPYVAEVNAVVWREMADLSGVAPSRAEVKRENDFLLRAVRCACVTRELAGQLQRLGVDASRTIVAPNGVDTQLFSPDTAATAEAKERLKGHFPIIAFAGTGAPTLDAETMVAAAEQVLEHKPSARFLFVGQSNEDLRDWGMPPTVLKCAIATGPVLHNQVPGWLACSDICWAAFLNSYGSPLKLVEYMAMSKPVIAACAGQAEECIEDAGCGRAVARGDWMALAQEICRVAETTTDAREALGRSGRDWVTHGRDWLSVARAMIDGLGPGVT